MSARSRTSLASLASLALLVVIASPARAQTSAYAATAPGDTALDAPVAREIELARARGLPAEPLLAKVREGRLKRAASPRIHVAVVALATRLDSARSALGDHSATDELIAGADALAAGATPASLRAVRAAAPVRSVTAPLGALAQLMASGFTVPRALPLVLELMKRNASTAQLLAFAGAVQSDVAAGVPGEESAVFRLRTIGESSSVIYAPTSIDIQPALQRPAPAPTSSPRRRP